MVSWFDWRKSTNCGVLKHGYGHGYSKWCLAKGWKRYQPGILPNGPSTILLMEEILARDRFLKKTCNWDVYHMGCVPRNVSFWNSPPSRNSFNSPNFVASKSKKTYGSFFAVSEKKGIKTYHLPYRNCGVVGCFNHQSPWEVSHPSGHQSPPSWRSAGESRYKSPDGKVVALETQGNSLKDWRFGWYMKGPRCLPWRSFLDH